MSILGTGILVAIILISIPFLIPKVLGYGVYAVLSDSMEPTYKEGSIVYIKKESPSKIQTGDSIMFRMSEESKALTTHRVIEVDVDKELFYTKGDANEGADAMPVSFERLVGKAVYSIPYLGTYAEFIQSVTGIITGVTLFILSLLLWGIGAILKPKKEIFHS